MCVVTHDFCTCQRACLMCFLSDMGQSVWNAEHADSASDILVRGWAHEVVFALGDSGLWSAVAVGTLVWRF